MAFLLAIEGADGAGKGTVAAVTVQALTARGTAAALVSFPRYRHTVGGHAIGDMLAGRIPVSASPRAAAVLYALDRLESAGFVAAQAAACEVLVFDRYIASNLAYQVARADPSERAALADWIVALECGQFALPPPDLSVYLDTPLAVSRRLIALKAKRSYTDAAFDANEADDALQSRVRDAYEALAASDRLGRWARIATTRDGASRPPAELAAEVIAAMDAAREHA